MSGALVPAAEEAPQDASARRLSLELRRRLLVTGAQLQDLAEHRLGAGAEAARLVETPELVVGIGVARVLAHHGLQRLDRPVDPLRVLGVGLGEEDAPMVLVPLLVYVRHRALEHLDGVPVLGSPEELAEYMEMQGLLAGNQAAVIMICGMMMMG